LKPNRTKYIVGIVIGVILLMSPFIAYFASVFTISRAFTLMSKAGAEISSQALASKLEPVYYVVAAGLIGFFCGIVLLTLSIVFYVRADRKDRAATVSSLYGTENI